MHIEIISNIDQFLSLRDSWNQLLSNDDQQTLPLTHDWVTQWWLCFGNGHQLNVRCIYQDTELLAIAPFMKTRMAYRGINCSVVKLMANGHSPFSSIITRPDTTPNQLSAILDLLLKSFSSDILIFGKISRNCEVYSSLTSEPRAFGLRYGISESLATPKFDINGDWLTFYKSRRRNFRKGTTNKVNKFNNNEDLSIIRELITTVDHPVLLEMVEVSKRSWKSRIKNDLGSNLAGRNFLLGLVRTFGATGNISLWIARDKDRAIAFEFHLIYNNTVYPLRADFDESYKRVSPGSVLEYTAIKTLFDEGKTKEYYSCGDNYEYLRNWTNEVKEHANVEIFANSWKSAGLHAFEYRLIPILRTFRDYLKRF